MSLLKAKGFTVKEEPCSERAFEGTRGSEDDSKYPGQNITQSAGCKQRCMTNDDSRICNPRCNRFTGGCIGWRIRNTSRPHTDTVTGQVDSLLSYFQGIPSISCDTELHCCIKNTQWAVLHWVTCSFNTVNVGTVVSFETIPHTAAISTHCSISPKYSTGVFYSLLSNLQKKLTLFICDQYIKVYVFSWNKWAREPQTDSHIVGFNLLWGFVDDNNNVE